MRDGHPVVKPQQRYIVIEIEKAEGAGDGPKDESRLRSLVVVAAVVFSERDLDHKPHEPENQNIMSHVDYVCD